MLVTINPAYQAEELRYTLGTVGGTRTGLDREAPVNRLFRLIAGGMPSIGNGGPLANFTVRPSHTCGGSSASADENMLGCSPGRTLGKWLANR